MRQGIMVRAERKSKNEIARFSALRVQNPAISNSTKPQNSLIFSRLVVVHGRLGRELINGQPIRTHALNGRYWVESRCGAVAVGRTYQLPPLSSGGALLVRPCLRFHIRLIQPDLQISRIRLSDK